MSRRAVTKQVKAYLVLPNGSGVRIVCPYPWRSSVSGTFRSAFIYILAFHTFIISIPPHLCPTGCPRRFGISACGWNGQPGGPRRTTSNTPTSSACVCRLAKSAIQQSASPDSRLLASSGAYGTVQPLPCLSFLSHNPYLIRFLAHMQP